MPLTLHILYRFFDIDEVLLYVGITNNPARRWAKHEKDKSWWLEVTDIQLEHFNSREEVEKAEIEAIKNEKPLYNIKHSLGVGSFGPKPRVCSCGSTAVVVYVHTGEAMKFHMDYAEWEKKFELVGPDGQVMGHAYSLADADDMPNPAEWQCVCDSCYPENESALYQFDIPVTWEAWINWTAHLMGKNWLDDTNWKYLLDSLGARD